MFGIRLRAIVVALIASTLAVMLLWPALILAEEPYDDELSYIPRSGQYRPAPYENGLLYSAGMPDGGRLTLLDKPSGDESPVERVGLCERPWKADRYGSLIAVENADEVGSIVVKDLSTGVDTVVPGASDDNAPAIWNNTVVFSRFIDGRARVCAFDLAAGHLTVLSNEAPGYAGYPDIHEDTVVFAADDDIWVTSVQGGAAERIVDRDGDQDTPAIWRNLVIYADWSKGLSDLWVYNLETGEDHALIAEPGTQFAPSIWGTTLAFEDYGTSTTSTRIRTVELNGDFDYSERPFSGFMPAWFTGLGVGSFEPTMSWGSYSLTGMIEL